MDYSAPYQYGDFGLGWDTIFETDGPYLLVGRVTDDSGCQESDTTNVYVDNSDTGIPCLGFEEDAEAALTGAFDEGVTVDVVLVVMGS